MRKTKIGFVLLVLVFSFYLFSCGNDNMVIDETTTDNSEPSFSVTNIFDDHPDNSITRQSSYDLIVGDRLNPFNKKFNKDLMTLTSNHPDILSVDESGNVEALSTGSAIITAYKNDEKIDEISFYVRERKEINYNSSDELLEELMDTLSLYDGSNYFSITYFDVDRECKITERFRKSPFYYELSGEGTNFGSEEHTKIEVHNDKYFISKINDHSKYIYRERINLEDYIDVSPESFVDEIDLDIDDFSAKYELNKINNTYILKVSLKDYLPAYREVEYATDSVYEKVLGSTIVELQFVCRENSVDINYTVDLHCIDSNLVYDLTYNSSIICSFSSFSEFNDQGYRYGPAKTIEDIYDETDLKTLHYIEGSSNYYYGYLEAGTYAVENPTAMAHISSLYVSIYNDKKELLNSKLSLHDRWKFCNLFTINESGYYYIAMGYQILDTLDFNLTKLETNSKTPLPLQSYSGSINSRYDYQEFTYDSQDENEVIKITNNKDYPVYIYSDFKKNSDNANYFTIDGGEYLYIDPKDGESSIYVISNIFMVNDLDYDYSYDYDITVESIHNDNGLDMDNLDLVTEEYGKDYFIGYFYEPRKVKLIAEKTGYYDFDNVFQILINDKTVNRESCGYYLETGEYILTLWTNSHLFYVSPIKYTYYDTSDFDLDVTIPISGDPNFTMLRQKKMASNQVVKYYFTLETTAILFIDIVNVQIFDENDVKVSFKTNGLHGFEAILQEFKPGRYYFRCDSLSYDNPISIYIYTSETEEYLSTDLTNMLELGYSYKADKNAQPYEGYYRVFESERDIDLTKSSGVIYVVDSQMNLLSLTRENGKAFYHLEANHKYYVIILKENYQDIVITEI